MLSLQIKNDAQTSNNNSIVRGGLNAMELRPQTGSQAPGLHSSSKKLKKINSGIKKGKFRMKIDAISMETTGKQRWENQPHLKIYSFFIKEREF